MADRRSGHHAHVHPSVDFQGDQGAPHRDAADEVHRSVDRIDDPADPAASVGSVLLADHTVAGPVGGEAGTDGPLRGPVGFGDGRGVGLGLDPQREVAEQGQAHPVGQIGQLEGEAEFVAQFHACMLGRPAVGGKAGTVDP